MSTRMISIFNEASFSEKKEFNNNKKMTGITDADYRHTERVWEDFRI